MGNRQISTRLIYRKIEGLLSPAEEEIFDTWLNEDVKHRRYYEKIRDELLRDEKRELSKTELQEAWSIFENRMQKQRKVEKKRFFIWGTGIAAAVAVVLGCCLFL